MGGVTTGDPGARAGREHRRSTDRGPAGLLGLGQSCEQAEGVPAPTELGEE